VSGHSTIYCNTREVWDLAVSFLCQVTPPFTLNPVQPIPSHYTCAGHRAVLQTNISKLFLTHTQKNNILCLLCAFAKMFDFMIYIYDMIDLLTAIGWTSGGSSTLHIYTQTVHRTIQLYRILHT
jgi:hypothetical protein